MVSSKTLLMSVTEPAFRPDFNVSIATVAGFQLSISGRFWVSTEALCNLTINIALCRHAATIASQTFVRHGRNFPGGWK